MYHTLPLGRAALRRSGDDLAIVSYGAYVHVALRVAERLAADGIESSVVDLRSLVPLDRAAVLAVARRCHRLLIVHEDSRTGGIGESVAAIVQEEAFESLDAPIRIVGALDTPVPYSGRSGGWSTRAVRVRRAPATTKNLLISDRLDRIQAHRADGGNAAGGERHRNDKRRCCSEYRRIRGAHPVEQRAEQPRSGK